MKRITPEQAARAIDMAGISLSSEEAASLNEVYVGDDGAFNFGEKRSLPIPSLSPSPHRMPAPHFLRAAKFIDDVNDHRSNGYYETRPVARTADSRRKSVSAFVVSPLGGGSAGYFVPLTPEERSTLQEVLERARHLCHTRGLVVKQFLRDFDTNHIGLVTVSRFEREAASLFPSLTPAERGLLAKAYMTADKADVRYMVLHNDVTPGEQEEKGEGGGRPPGTLAHFPPQTRRRAARASGA